MGGADTGSHKDESDKTNARSVDSTHSMSARGQSGSRLKLGLEILPLAGFSILATYMLIRGPHVIGMEMFFWAVALVYCLSTCLLSIFYFRKNPTKTFHADHVTMTVDGETKWRRDYVEFQGIRYREVSFSSDSGPGEFVIELVHPTPQLSVTLLREKKRMRYKKRIALLEQYAREFNLPIVESKILQRSSFYYIIPVVMLGLFAYFSTQQGSAIFFIENQSGTTISSGAVYITARPRSFESIKAGGTLTKRISFGHDGPFEVEVILASGQKLTTGRTGYITHDTKKKISVKVMTNRIEVRTISSTKK